MTTVLPALLALLAAAPAPAPEKLAIVELDAPEFMMGLGGQVTRALVDSAKKQKLAVLEPDALRTQLNEKDYQLLRKCGGNVGCVAQYLQPLAARAVVGTLARDEKNYLLRLWLVDLKQLTVVADVDRSILIAARRFQKDVDQAVPPLLRGEREARGTLKVTTNLKDAEISLNGELLGAGTLSLQLKPGKYEVKVERKKYLPVTRLVPVEAGQTTEGAVTLLLIPGEIPDEEVVPPLPAPGPGEVNAPPALRLSPQSWLCGALTLAAAGTGLVFGLNERSKESALLAGYDQATGVYSGTRVQALEVQENATLANVAFGVAGAAAAATVVFVLLDVRSPPPVEVAPTGSPHGAGIIVGGRF